MFTHRIRKVGSASIKVSAIALLSASCALVATTTSAGTVYRWTDAQGNAVMSDRPPPAGTVYTTLNGGEYGASVNAPSDPNAVSPPAETTASSLNSAPSAASDGNREVVIEKRPKLCEQAKDNIFKLETFPRMRVTDDDGEVRFMTDEERESQLATAKKVAEANC